MFTIFGAAGMVGSAVARHLSARGHEVHRVTRSECPARGDRLGHIIFAIGKTGDFRGAPLATAEAHVGMLTHVLENYRYDSLLYLSSARLYKGALSTREDTPVVVNPSDPDDAYNATKITGEAICLSTPVPTIRVARLSNVVGIEASPNTFIGSIFSDLRRSRSITVRTSAESEKDYISIDDVVSLLEMIALRGRERLYNVASGRNVCHRELARLLTEHAGAEVVFASSASRVSFRPIDIRRISSEFGLQPAELETYLPAFLSLVRSAQAPTPDAVSTFKG